jgi:hypothetical protein
MFAETIQYEIQEVVSQGHHPGRMAYEIRSKFARGRQVRTSRREEVVRKEIRKIPETPFDWLKALLIQWEPSLGFGWLVPRLVMLTIDVEVHYHETFWNVAPLALPEDDRAGYISVFRTPPLDLNCGTWLNSEPPSTEDIARARKEKLQHRQAAWHMDY